jgi:hypothetical protein
MGLYRSVGRRAVPPRAAPRESRALEVAGRPWGPAVRPGPGRQTRSTAQQRGARGHLRQKQTQLPVSGSEAGRVLTSGPGESTSRQPSPNDRQAAADIRSPDVKDLHTYGLVFKTKWITIHDTETDGTAPFNANALAKSKGGTPFKRPENGVFRPGTGFREFFFDETGDTTLTTEAGTTLGGFGSALRLSQEWPGADEGRLGLLFNGDQEHNSFDNVAFWDANHIVYVEDRGDGLHTALNALDSGWMLDVRKDYSKPQNKQSASWPRAATPRPPSTPGSPGCPASRMKATTRSPASTSLTATRVTTACWETRSPGPSTMAGGSSTPSSTATTSPGKSSLRGRARKTATTTEPDRTPGAVLQRPLGARG